MTRGPRTLLFGTANPGKQREILRILEGSGWEVLFPPELGIRLEVEETGATFAENARLKGRAFREVRPDLWVAAEDSGIVVPALGGEPGVYSARYGGQGDDAARNRHLLARMAGLRGSDRAAYYFAVVVLLDPRGAERAFEGRVDGSIAAEPSGAGGFGYDPLFLDTASGLTFARLSPGEKDRISHRGRALCCLRAFLDTLEG